MRDQRELALQCLEVEDAGGSVIEFLHSLGFISASATWQRLQLNELGRLPSKLRDGKENVNMGKLTLEDKKKAVQIAVDGGNPLEYIRSCGVKNAAEAWGKIKLVVKETDPEAFEKIPKRLPNQKKGEDVIMADEVPIATPIPPLVMDPVIEKFADHLKGNEAIEMPTAEEVIPKEFQKHMKPGALKKREKKFSQPSICNGFEVIGIRGQYGVYRANDEVNYFDFQPFGGELCMSPEDWHEQLDELHRAAKVLGVEL